MARKPDEPRSYESPLRRRQAEATRAAIVGSAGRLFERDGYARTTINAVADDAGVSPESVYGRFGNKRNLLWAVFELAASGTDDPRPVIDENLIDAILAEPDPHGRLALMTERTRGMLDRSAALNEMVHLAARTDPGLRDLELELDARRRADVEGLVGLLAEAGPLRLELEEAVEVLWAIATSDLYLRLRRGCGWSADRSDRIVADIIDRLLLP